MLLKSEGVYDGLSDFLSTHSFYAPHLSLRHVRHRTSEHKKKPHPNGNGSFMTIVDFSSYSLIKKMQQLVRLVFYYSISPYYTTTLQNSIPLLC
jgi:hypothetical protein